MSTTKNWLARHGHWLLTLYVAFVFIQSLFFKFTGSPDAGRGRGQHRRQ